MIITRIPVIPSMTSPISPPPSPSLAQLPTRHPFTLQFSLTLLLVLLLLLPCTLFSPVSSSFLGVPSTLDSVSYFSVGQSWVRSVGANAYGRHAARAWHVTPPDKFMMYAGPEVYQYSFVEQRCVTKLSLNDLFFDTLPAPTQSPYNHTDAVMTWTNNRLYLFSDRYYFKLGSVAQGGGYHSTSTIGGGWSGLPDGRLEGWLTMDFSFSMAFTPDGELTMYDNELDHVVGSSYNGPWPQSIQDYFPGLPTDPVRVSDIEYHPHTGWALFFYPDQYYAYDVRRRAVVPGYPKSIVPGILLNQTNFDQNTALPSCSGAIDLSSPIGFVSDKDLRLSQNVSDVLDMYERVCTWQVILPYYLMSSPSINVTNDENPTIAPSTLTFINDGFTTYSFDGFEFTFTKFLLDSRLSEVRIYEVVNDPTDPLAQDPYILNYQIVHNRMLPHTPSRAFPRTLNQLVYTFSNAAPPVLGQIYSSSKGCDRFLVEYVKKAPDLVTATTVPTGFVIHWSVANQPTSVLQDLQSSVNQGKQSPSPPTYTGPASSLHFASLYHDTIHTTVIQPTRILPDLIPLTRFSFLFHVFKNETETNSTVADCAWNYFRLEAYAGVVRSDVIEARRPDFTLSRNGCNSTGLSLPTTGTSLNLLQSCAGDKFNLVGYPPIRCNFEGYYDAYTLVFYTSKDIHVSATGEYGIESTCGGSTHLLSGVWVGSFTDGSATGGEPSAMISCSWLLTLDDPDALAIVVQVTSWGANIGDTVTMFNGADSSAPVLAVVDETNVGLAVITAVPVAYVAFTAAPVILNYDGFHANYSVVFRPDVNSLECDGLDDIFDVSSSSASSSGGVPGLPNNAIKPLPPPSVPTLDEIASGLNSTFIVPDQSSLQCTAGDRGLLSFSAEDVHQRPLPLQFSSWFEWHARFIPSDLKLSLEALSYLTYFRAPYSTLNQTFLELEYGIDSTVFLRLFEVLSRSDGVSMDLTVPTVSGSYMLVIGLLVKQQHISKRQRHGIVQNANLTQTTYPYTGDMFIIPTTPLFVDVEPAIEVTSTSFLTDIIDLASRPTVASLLTILANVTSSGESGAVATGLISSTIYTAGVTQQFRLYLRDIFGNYRTVSGADVRCFAAYSKEDDTGGNLGSVAHGTAAATSAQINADVTSYAANAAVRVELVDSGDGSYLISFTPIHTGYYYVTALVSGSDLFNSPLSMAIQSGPPDVKMTSVDFLLLTPNQTALSISALQRLPYPTTFQVTIVVMDANSNTILTVGKEVTYALDGLEDDLKHIHVQPLYDPTSTEPLNNTFIIQVQIDNHEFDPNGVYFHLLVGSQELDNSPYLLSTILPTNINHTHLSTAVIVVIVLVCVGLAGSLLALVRYIRRRQRAKEARRLRKMRGGRVRGFSGEGGEDEPDHPVTLYQTVAEEWKERLRRELLKEIAWMCADAIHLVINWIAYVSVLQPDNFIYDEYSLIYTVTVCLAIVCFGVNVYRRVIIVRAIWRELHKGVQSHDSNAILGGGANHTPNASQTNTNEEANKKEHSSSQTHTATASSGAPLMKKKAKLQVAVDEAATNAQRSSGGGGGGDFPTPDSVTSPQESDRLTGETTAPAATQYSPPSPIASAIRTTATPAPPVDQLIVTIPSSAASSPTTQRHLLLTSSGAPVHLRHRALAVSSEPLGALGSQDHVRMAGAISRGPLSTPDDPNKHELGGRGIHLSFHDPRVRLAFVRRKMWTAGITLVSIFLDTLPFFVLNMIELWKVDELRSKWQLCLSIVAASLSIGYKMTRLFLYWTDLRPECNHWRCEVIVEQLQFESDEHLSHELLLELDQQRKKAEAARQIVRQRKVEQMRLRKATMDQVEAAKQYQRTRSAASRSSTSSSSSGSAPKSSAPLLRSSSDPSLTTDPTTSSMIELQEFSGQDGHTSSYQGDHSTEMDTSLQRASSTSYSIAPPSATGSASSSSISSSSTIQLHLPPHPLAAANENAVAFERARIRQEMMACIAEDQQQQQQHTADDKSFYPSFNRL